MSVTDRYDKSPTVSRTDIRGRSKSPVLTSAARIRLIKDSDTFALLTQDRFVSFFLSHHFATAHNYNTVVVVAQQRQTLRKRTTTSSSISCSSWDEDDEIDVHIKVAI